jgi:hypothetical protein
MGDQRLDDILDGPRGRRLCLSLVTSAEPSLWTLTIHATRSPNDTSLRTELARGIAGFNAMNALTDAALLQALADSTDRARYWQEPDEEDQLLEDPQLREALEPVALHAATHASTQWWRSGIALESQNHVQWTGESTYDPPELTGASGRLERWKADIVEGERRAARRPKPVAANISGVWWSTPAIAGLVTTTRSLPGLGAVKLMATEDRFGWTTADVWPMKPAADCRVYEISGPDAWVELVARYPMEVTFSRRHDWWRASGHDGTWIQPDWSAIASDFDAVHLTAFGYLSTAGRGLPVGDARTMLAGWDADETYWLNDVLEPTGEPVTWHRDDAPWTDGAWTVAPPEA